MSHPTSIVVRSREDASGGVQIPPNINTVAASFDQGGYGFPVSYRFALAAGTPAATGVGQSDVLVVERTCKIVKCFIVAKVGPTGEDLVCDVNRNGASIWDTIQSNRIRLNAGSQTGTQTTFDTTMLFEGDLLTVDIDQVGSTVAGQGISVQLLTMARNL